MGYVFLGLGVFTALTKGFFGKKISDYARSFMGAINFGGARMLLSAIFGLVIFIFLGKKLFLPLSALPVVIVGASCTAVFVVSWLVLVKNYAYMLTDIFLTVGTAIPLALSFFVFGERVRLSQWIAMVALVVSACLMCFSKINKKSLSLKAIATLVVCGLTHGGTSFCQKWLSKACVGVSAATYNVCIYALAAALLFGVGLVVKLTTNKKQGEVYSIPALKGRAGCYTCIVAVSTYLNAYFLTLAANYLLSATLYPLRQGLTLIFSFIMSITLFKQRATFVAVLGVLLCCASLVLMNV